MSWLKAGLAAALLLIAAPATASAEETIDNYASDITVHKDGTLSVHEQITVTAEGERIRHGIYRDFPTVYPDSFGKKDRVSFDVARVTLDGQPVNYSRESLSNGVRIKIGSADSLVSPGRHTYRIDYTTDRQIGFFADFDSLYWNVTGTGWIFPILKAEATVHLPAGATITREAAYTGAQGSTARNATATRLDDADIRFETTEPLGAGKGLTIAVGFAKGAIAPPTPSQKAESFFADNGPILAACLGLLLLTLYFFITWWRFGRDPARGTVIPLFGPPKGFSPAAVRYVRRMGYDRKAFAAALIGMAVKGFMTIREDHRQYTLTRTAKSAEEAGLSKGERGIAKALFGAWGDSITLRQDNHDQISRAITLLQNALSGEYEFTYFRTNLGWFIGGMAILIVTGLATAALSDDPAGAGVAMAFLTALAAAASFCVHHALKGWRDVMGGPGSRILHLLRAIGWSILVVPLLAILAAVLLGVAGEVPLWASLALIAAGALAYLFYYLLKAPTAAGARILDEIEGFRVFLDTAEKDRLEKLNPPEVTPQVFERFLPYAIALDCENQWSRRFEAEAAAAAADPSRAAAYAYTPLWYSGASFGRLGTAGFVSAIGSSVASAAAASATAPGSSSGFGGGGFSGGGGGGGGGGGW